MAGIPALYGRRIGAVGGGVSCGKTAFINSLLTNASCRLAEDEQPVTVLPCHVIAGSDVEKAVARGVSRWGGIFEMPVETCLNLSYSALRSRDFSLLKIMRGMTLLTPVRDRLFRHLCLMDTPGYNPPETYGEADARNTALDAVSKADFLIWLVDAASGTPSPHRISTFFPARTSAEKTASPCSLLPPERISKRKTPWRTCLPPWKTASTTPACTMKAFAPGAPGSRRASSPSGKSRKAEPWR